MKAAATLCRDCAWLGVDRGPRCVACGSPRIVQHAELDRLAIAHVDCDAFFAAIEKRDDPALRDVPLIIGGGRRGVVSTACYIARIAGVRSAMPMFKALEACPDAVVIKPDLERYAKVGREVKRLMGELTPLVQPVSIDEAFLDLSGTERVHHACPAQTLARFAARIEREIGISVSVGLSYNKFLAKIASDQNKPRGYTVLGRADAPGFLAGKPIAVLPGIGKRTQEKLARAGLHRVSDLAGRSERSLRAILGQDADRLLRLARGEDMRVVDPVRETKSVSAETTFPTDLGRYEDLEPILWRLCEKVSDRLKHAQLGGVSVTLKLKDTRFRLTTRTRSGLAPTQLASRIFEPARALLRGECDGRLYRLIGIGAGDLRPAADADRGDLADPRVAAEKRIETAIDAVRERFGRAAVQKGIGLGRG